MDIKDVNCKDCKCSKKSKQNIVMNYLECSNHHLTSNELKLYGEQEEYLLAYSFGADESVVYVGKNFGCKFFEQKE